MNRQVLTTITLVLVSLVPRSTLAEWSGQTADEVVSFDDNEYARGVQVLFAHPLPPSQPDALLHLFWAEDAPSVREVHYGRSSDLGATWSSSTSDRVISLPDGNAVFEEPAIALGLEGELMVVWSEDDLSTREVHYGISTDGGLTFTSQTADFTLSDLSTQVDTGLPSVLYGPDGVVHVVWQQVVAGAAEVHYSRSTDGGATWSGSSGDRIISFPDGNGAITPKLFLGSAGRLFVAWREIGDLGGPVIHLGMSDDGGDTWTSEAADREISQPVRLMTDFDVAARWLPTEATSSATIVYTASFDTASPFHYEVYATRTDDDGETWDGETATVNVSFDEDHTRSASNPDAYLSPCGDAVYAVWDEEDEGAGTNEQHVSRSFSGGPWTGASGDSIVSFPDGEDGYRPSITGIQSIVTLPATGESATVWVAWTEFSGGATDNYEVHISASDPCGTSAVPPGTLRSALRVVPNPARHQLVLSLPDALLSTIQVVDAAGREIYQVTVRDREEFVWDLENRSGQRVAAGVYLVRVRSSSGRIAVAPIVVQP